MDRLGTYQRQLGGYDAYIPAPLPPNPPLDFSPELILLLTDAERAIGRLDGLAGGVPDMAVFVALYVKKEAELSSKIEGTQSSLDDILRYEATPDAGGFPADIKDVVNYVVALEYGLSQNALPLSLRLIRELHFRLLEGTRGADKRPGEFRTEQNWIGSGGAGIERATFIPPPPSEVPEALRLLERFLHDESMPALVHSALVHAQFETIHPFLDGNGRVGRLLISLLLWHRRALRYPLLYLSFYLSENRSEYYERLTRIRTHGDWEGWLTFFLRGALITAEDAISTIFAIEALRAKHRELIARHSTSRSAQSLLDLLYMHPLVTTKMVQEMLAVSRSTANTLLNQFNGLGIVEETTGQSHSRLFRYSGFIDLFTAD